jgi:flagellar basal-body rod protein FlgF
MDRMIYLAMSGAKATMQRQDMLAHNLANVSTTGFRAELQAFRAVPVRGDGASTRVYALETTTGYDATQGPVQHTGRPLDVAMQGNAWMAVQSLDGTEAYTRAGSLTVAADGTLMTQGGLVVIGDGGPVQAPPNAQLSIAPDGIISARNPDGQTVPVARLKMVTPEAPLQRGLDGLFRDAAGEELPADPNARLQDGALEGSNVSAIETMVAMISAARQFEHQMKMLKTAEQNENASAKLLSTNA